MVARRHGDSVNGKWISLLACIALLACGDDAAKAPSCEELQRQINTCSFPQTTKDQFMSFCTGKTEACRACLDGKLCGVTESCDSACGKN